MQDINIRLVIDGKEALANLRLTDEELVKISQGLRKVADDSRTTGGNIVGSFADIRNTLQGAREAWDLFSGAFGAPLKAFVQMEQFGASFDVLLGGIDKSKKRMAELVEFAKTTPFELPEVVSASKQLEVLTKGALSIGDGLRMVGDAASAGGVKIDELAMWFGRLYDGLQSGRPVGEAMMRLQELGLISGTARTKLENLTKSGKLQTEGWAVFSKEMERFSGSMNRQSQTLGGEISNLSDSFGQLKVAVGGSLAKPLGALVTHLTDLAGSMMNVSPELTGVIGALSLLAIASGGLQATGILPLIVDIKTLSYEMQFAKLTFVETALAEGTMTAMTRTASTAMKGLFASIGPVGWAIIGFTALAEIINVFGKSSDDSTEKVSAETQKLKEQKSEFNSLKNTILDTNKSQEARQKSLDEVNKLYPGLLSKTESDVRLNKDLAGSLKKVNDELEKKIRLSIYGEKYKKALEEKVTLEDSIPALEKQIDEQSKGDERGVITQSDRDKLENDRKALKKSTEDVAKWKEKLDAENAPPDSRTATTYGQEKEKLKNELSSLEEQLNNTSAGDKKGQNSIISKIKTVKNKLKKYEDDSKGGGSEDKNKVDDSYEKNVVTAEYPSTKFKDNDAVKKKYDKIIQDSSASISQFEKISSVVLPKLKTIEDRKKFLEGAQKTALDRMNDSDYKDHTEAVKVYYAISQKLAKYNGGLINQLDEQIKILETQKKSAVTLDELKSIEKQIADKQKQRTDIDTQLKAVEVLGKNKQSQINFEIEQLNKNLEEAKTIDDQIAIKSKILQKQDELNLLNEKIDRDARLKTPQKLTEKEKKEYGFSSLKQKIDDSDGTDVEKKRKTLEVDEEAALYQLSLSNYEDKEQRERDIHAHYSKEKRNIDKAEAKNKMDNFATTMNFIAGGFNQYTVIAKAASAIQAGINVSEAFTKALASAPPPLNFIEAGLVAAAGAIKVYDIVSAEPPRMKGMKIGGDVVGPGDGTSDSVNAWLSNGEYVINARSTAKYKPLIEMINNGAIEKFAKGGLIGGNSSYEFMFSGGNLAGLEKRLDQYLDKVDKWQKQMSFKFAHSEFKAGMDLYEHRKSFEV